MVGLTLVNEYQTQVVSRGELLVNVAECWGQVEAAQEKSDWDGLSS